MSAAGSISTGGVYRNAGAIVPLGGQVSQVGTLHNLSGFAAGFILQPQTAFSGGLPDEWNPDNDLDGLDDDEEVVAGSSLYNGDTDGDSLGDYAEVKIHGSSPVATDSDADGMSDPDELIAGTSLTDQSSVLSLAYSFMSDGRLEISWFGVAERVYTFEYTGSLGTDEWYAYPFEIGGTDSTIAFIDNPSAASNRFYRVHVRYEFIPVRLPFQDHFTTPSIGYPLYRD